MEAKMLIGDASGTIGKLAFKADVTNFTKKTYFDLVENISDDLIEIESEDVNDDEETNPTSQNLNIKNPPFLLCTNAETDMIEKIYSKCTYCFIGEGLITFTKLGNIQGYMMVPLYVIIFDHDIFAIYIKTCSKSMIVYRRIKCNWV